MDRMKEYLKYFRDAVAFSFAWLTICVLIISLISGNESIGTGFLLKLLGFCVWSSAAFITAFVSSTLKKRGFIIQLTVFYVLFIPAEILFFYSIGVFSGSGNMNSWIMFFVIIAVLYILALLIDVLIMKKQAVSYTEKLEEYKNNL
jgi:hypothetical protein